MIGFQDEMFVFGFKIFLNSFFPVLQLQCDLYVILYYTFFFCCDLYLRSYNAKNKVI